MSVFRRENGRAFGCGRPAPGVVVAVGLVAALVGILLVSGRAEATDRNLAYTIGNTVRNPGQTPAETADIKVNAVTVVTPVSATVGVPFVVTLIAELHNNGPDAATADVTFNLAMPADCTRTPNTALVAVAVNLPVSTGVALSKSWNVTCSLPSAHQFAGTASAAVNSPATDPTPENNSNQGTGTTDLVGLATPTPTPSPTPTPTPSPTPTPTPSPTSTPTPTPSPTAAPTTSPTPSPTLPGGGACAALSGAIPNAGVLIVGSPRSQLVLGTDGPDLIVVGAGRQLVIGRGGDDCIMTGGGDDTVIGGDGSDEVLLGSGNDMAVGVTGDDRLNGEGGADRLIGNQGDDILDGGADSEDLCIGGHGTDISADCEHEVGIP